VPVADRITHRLPLEEAPQGFKLMSTPGGSHLKVILVPGGDGSRQKQGSRVSC
jgi:hypothetical protein